VSVIVRAAMLVAFASTAVQAQGRYRVAIGIAGEAKPLVAEFRVCVPAETSDCGSWLVRSTSVDDVPVIRPLAATGPLRASTIADSISIDGDDIAIKSLVAGTKPARNVLREKDHTPRAIALTPDSRYVFVVFDDATGESGLIDLIELESMAVIDTLRVRGRPAGIAILR
jgi:hypothetical protein